MSRFLIGAVWEDCPHLTETAQAELLASIPEYQRAARSKGIPQLGSGAIYPIGESEIRVADFPIPDHWPRGYGMDTGGGAKPTAAVWGALDRDTQVLYLYAVYKRAASEPSIHAAAIRAKGAWIPGVADAAALIMTEHDSEQLVNVYRKLGLILSLPDKSVETGVQEVWDLMSSGRLKVFASCVAFFEEFRMYQRDKRGRIKKSNDHVLDATRYLVRSGRTKMKVQRSKVVKPSVLYIDQGETQGLGWMGS
jgi:hypothetical protein